jgi:hypothetical protein
MNKRTELQRADSPYLLNNAWTSKSFSLNFGPVLYQPTTCSLATPQTARAHQDTRIDHIAQTQQALRNPKQHTVNPLEHGEHRLMVIVVKEPDPRILVILLERHCKIKLWIQRATPEKPHRSNQSRNNTTAIHANGSNYIYIHSRYRETLSSTAEAQQPPPSTEA